jgi:hypothetical protein
MRTILLAALIAASVPVQAEVVTWTLDNVNFSDGGSASGFFNVDTDTGRLAITPPVSGSIYDGVDIRTTAGSVLHRATYRPFYDLGFADYLVEGGVFYAKWGASGFGDREFRLDIDADLHQATQGEFQILAGQETHTYPAFEQIPLIEAFRTVLPGGSVSATALAAQMTQVPELPALAVLGMGLGLLALVRANGMGK